jgi:hypothetical protein
MDRGLSRYPLYDYRQILPSLLEAKVREPQERNEIHVRAASVAAFRQRDGEFAVRYDRFNWDRIECLGRCQAYASVRAHETAPAVNDDLRRKRRVQAQRFHIAALARNLFGYQVVIRVPPSRVRAVNSIVPEDPPTG